MSEGMKKLVGFAIFGALIVAGIVGSDASDDSAVTRNAGIPLSDTLTVGDAGIPLSDTLTVGGSSKIPPKDGEVESEKGGDCCDKTLAMLGELITKVDALAQQQDTLAQQQDTLAQQQDTLAQQVAGLNVNQGNGGPTQEEVEQLLRDANCSWRGEKWNCNSANGAAIPLGSNFSGSNLAGAGFGVLDLTGVNFSGANLSGATFTGDLTGADFTNANLAGATFSGAMTVLMGADFTGANLAGTDFTNSQTEGAIGLP